MTYKKIKKLSFISLSLLISLTLCIPNASLAFAGNGKKSTRVSTISNKNKAVQQAFPPSSRLEFEEGIIPGATNVKSNNSDSNVGLLVTKSSKTKKSSSSKKKTYTYKKNTSKSKKKTTKHKKSTSKSKKKTTKYKGKSVKYKRIMLYALRYKGWRYQWGGRHTYTSFDCAGLVIHTYNNMCGLGINRALTNAHDLYKIFCKPIKKSEARPGDLIFWKGTYSHINYISHVGIYCGDNIAYAAGDPIGYYDIDKIKNIKKKPAKYFFGRLKGVRITKTKEFKGATLTPAHTTIYKSKSYELVYNYNYYVKKYPKIKEMYDGDDKKILQHFVRYGMKEGQQAKKTFNVKKYRSKNSDLRKRFKKKYRLYYYHFMNHGFKQSRKTT